jgi:hypothetical protein
MRDRLDGENSIARLHEGDRCRSDVRTHVNYHARATPIGAHPPNNSVDRIGLVAAEAPERTSYSGSKVSSPRDPGPRECSLLNTAADHKSESNRSFKISLEMSSDKPVVLPLHRRRKP